MKSAVDIESLKKRKKFLEKEMQYINGLIELYTDEEETDTKNDDGTSHQTTNTPVQQLNQKSSSFSDIVFGVIEELGEPSVIDVIEKIKGIYPNHNKYKDEKFQAKVRTGIWTLKKKGKINARKIGINKYLYSIKK